MRRRAYYKRNSGKKAVFAVVMALTIILVTLLGNYTSRRDVAAMRVPYNTVINLKALADDKGYNFCEVLSVYMIKNNFFPGGKENAAYDELKRFVEHYRWHRFFVSSSKTKLYQSLFSSILDDLQYFPLEDLRYPAAAYIYGDVSADSSIISSYTGIDIVDRENAGGKLAVRAVCGGVITGCGYKIGKGYYIYLLAESGITYYYTGLKSLEGGIADGAAVGAGDRMGLIGYTTPASLHFEIITSLNGNTLNIDPYIFLRLSE